MDTTLPDPSELPYSPDEWEWIYGLWTVWRATEKRFLPSQLIHEIQTHKRALDGLLDMEGLYGRVYEELRQQKQDAGQTT